MRSRHVPAWLGVLCAVGALCLAACGTTTAGSGRLGSGRYAPPSAGTPAYRSTLSIATTAVPPPTPATASATPGVHPAPATPLRTATATGQDGTAYPVQIWAELSTPTCADHAYGAPMIKFLTTHPCAGLTRRLATTSVGGRAVGMAISDLGFRGTYPDTYRTAGEFIKLVTKDGTGNLDDLLRDGYRLPSGPTSVPTPDAFSAVGQDDGVEVVDAWYLSGTTPNNDPALVRMEQSIFLQVH